MSSSRDARTALLDEARRIDENALYTGQALFEFAKMRGGSRRFWMLLAPAIVASAAGLCVAVGGPSWVAAIAALCSAVSAVGVYLGVGGEQAEMEALAKAFTVQRHTARGVHTVFPDSLSDEELACRVRELQVQHGAYISACPSISKKAFEKARKRIQDGKVFDFDWDEPRVSR